MIGTLAERKLQLGGANSVEPSLTDLDADALPNWQLAATAA